MLTNEQIEEIKQLAETIEKGTPGPWIGGEPCHAPNRRVNLWLAGGHRHIATLVAAPHRIDTQRLNLDSIIAGRAAGKALLQLLEEREALRGALENVVKEGTTKHYLDPELGPVESYSRSAQIAIEALGGEVPRV